MEVYQALCNSDFLKVREYVKIDVSRFLAYDLVYRFINRTGDQLLIF